jgi:hypothetical protein
MALRPEGSESWSTRTHSRRRPAPTIPVGGRNAVRQHTCGATAERPSAAARAKPSVSGPSIATAMPGLVQNCPAPKVSEATQPAQSGCRAPAGPQGSTNIGFTDPSSPKKGMGSGRAAHR